MDISSASLPNSEPRFQAQNSRAGETPAQSSPIYDPAIPAEQNSELVNQSAETNPRATTGLKLSDEQTLKPYGTLLLPYRGTVSTVSVMA